MSSPNSITVTLNGSLADLPALPHEMLLEVLRRQGLHGCRESCGQGVCGTCAVLVDQRVVASCIMLAHLADGTEIETVEGLAPAGRLSTIQEAFVSEAGFQCGFCTPGMILTATQFLRENQNPSDEQIAHYLAGNICRCGAYPEIISAVQKAASEIRAQLEIS
jgi:aerobic-type carbon monoxide dehydrogenase small subunit (CoxS/CutS family)